MLDLLLPLLGVTDVGCITISPLCLFPSPASGCRFVCSPPSRIFFPSSPLLSSVITLVHGRETGRTSFPPLCLLLSACKEEREKREYIADSLGKLCSPMSKVSVLMEGKKVAIVYWVIGESREGFGLPRERKKRHSFPGSLLWRACDGRL